MLINVLSLSNMKNKEYSILFFLAAGFSFLGALNLPNGYYFFLRVFLFVISSLLVLKFKNESFIRVAFVLIAILFNPIFVVYLHSKIAWVCIDIIVGALFLERGLKLYGKGPEVVED